MTRVVFPEFSNSHNTLFGGQALKWMDELAFIAASQHFSKDFVTIKVSSVKFLKAIRVNGVVEFVAQVVSQGRVKVDVEVKGYISNGSDRELAIDSIFTLAPVDEKGHPVRL